MNLNTRNSMFLGGLLVAIATLLTFGPVQSWLGAADLGVQATPHVAAGPAASRGFGTLASATTGAINGAKIGTAGLAVHDDTVYPRHTRNTQNTHAIYEIGKTHEGVLYAGAWSDEDEAADRARAARAAAAAAAAAAVAVGDPSGSAPVASTLPSVSAGPPNTAAAFDSAFNAGGGPGTDVSPAGLVVDRFAPPVAAVGASPTIDVAGRTFGIQAGGVRASCDAPGAGCQNLRGAGVVPVNPPIIGGVRPVPAPVQN